MITIVNGNVQTPGGLIVPNGSISFQLNVDATIIAAPFGIILAEESVAFQFDATGNLQSGARLYSNAELQPQNIFGLGTYYLVTFYDANGARINKNPLWWQFVEAANSTVSISQMTPYAVIGGNILFYPVPVGGGGTVTSVSFTGDGMVLSSTPSAPVTTAGTVSATLLIQGANLVLVGPVSGPAAAPTFRALISADIPNIDASKITSGLLALARGGTNADLSATGGASQVLKQISSGAAITVGQLAAADLSNGVTGSGAVVLAASPTLTGTPALAAATATTPATNDNSTKVATTAYVQAQPLALGIPITTKVTLSAAQMKSIASNPPAILPAPGAGNYYVVLACSAVYNPGTTPYTATFSPTYGLFYDWVGIVPIPNYTVPTSGTTSVINASLITAATVGSTGAQTLNLGMNTLNSNLMAVQITATGIGNKPTSLVTNKALRLFNNATTTGATVQAAVIAGNPATVTISASGRGYAINDVITLNTGGTTAQRRYTVTSVDAVGGITGISVTTPSSAIDFANVFAVANNYGVLQVTSSGVGALLNVTSVVGGQNGVAASTLNAGGSGYAPGDTGTITVNGFAGTAATYTVLTIGGGGSVATYSITSVGAGYFIANGVATVKTTGAGTAFTVNITAVGGGYAINDTGTFGNGTYTVNTVDANGNVLTYTLSSPPTSLPVSGTPLATTKGGGQPGVGFGLSLLVTQTANDVTLGDGTVDVNITYMVLSA